MKVGIRIKEKKRIEERKGKHVICFCIKIKGKRREKNKKKMNGSLSS